VRLGASLPILGLGGQPVGAGTFADGARLLERLGYDSLWVFDAVGRGFMLPDPLMALTIAATVTERVELGTGVLQLPIRNAAEVAHRALTLHLVADGRLLLGVGPGSTPADFVAFGGDFTQRMTRFADELPSFRELLRSGKAEGVDLTPWAATAGGPPVYYAAWRGRWVERAAKEADGWIASAAHNDDATLADAIARFREAGGTRAIVTNVQLAADIGPGIERLARLRELGFDDGVVLDLAASEPRFAAVREGYERAG